MPDKTPSRTDVMYEILYNQKFVPLPSPKVNIKTTIVDGKPTYLMKNYTTGLYYDLDELSNQIWNATNGKRTSAQIVEEIRRQKPRVKERDILGTLLFFAENNLLESSFEQQAPKKRFKVVSPFEMRLAVIKHSNNFLQRLNKKMQPLFSARANRFLLWTCIVFITVSTLLFGPEIVSIYGNKANFEILGSSVVGFFFYTCLPLAPILAIHEIAHGLTLAHYGGQPGEIGTGLYYFSPMFYVETADGWGLSRSHRMMVYLAGNFSTLLIGSALFVIHLFIRIPQPGSLILTMTSFYCFTMAMFNFAPPFETDGYYVLTDVVNMPNLRQDAYSYLGSIFNRALGRQVKTKIKEPDNRKRRIFIFYGVMSVAWILYVVYQTSVFFVYMLEDVTGSLSRIFTATLASQALSMSIVLIALLSTIYFGMQIIGYGMIFSAAIKKATAKHLKVEPINDRNLAVFAYLPPQAPESLSMNLKTRMEKTAGKLTSNYQMKQVGRSWITIMKLGQTNLAQVQIKENLGRIESGFASAYQSIITSNEKVLQQSTGIYAPHKSGLTALFNQIGNESVEAGNSGARAVVRAYQEKQSETIRYLLSSVFGTIWTIEVQPSEEYNMVREWAPHLLLEDLTLTDLYGDTENFKKRIIYGFDSLAQLATEADVGLLECVNKPEEYQLISVFEPIRSRITFVGRTEQIEKNLGDLAHLIVAQTWSGYIDDLLSQTNFALSTLNRSILPSAKEMREMSSGELAVLSKDLSVLTENRKLVDKCLEDSETHIAMNNQSLQQLKTTLKPSKTFKIGLLDALFHVNLENMENVPGRIREFRNQWRMVCERIEGVQKHVEKEYEERKPEIARKNRKMLRIYPIAIALSIALLTLSFQTFLATWRIELLSVALISQGLYWFFFYRMRKSFCKVTRYPSHAFSTSQTFLLATTEAIYGYAITGDILTPLEWRAH